MSGIEQESEQDGWAVEALYDTAFGPARSALSSYRLREGVAPVAGLSLVVRDGDGGIAAAIRFWPVSVAGQAALLLGPIAVHPTRQGEGLGAALMRAGLERAAAAGWARVLLVGDAPYYARFGFVPHPGLCMPPPTDPARVLALALEPGGWDGIAGPVDRAARKPHLETATEEPARHDSPTPHRHGP